VTLCPSVKDLSVLYCNRSVAHFKLGALDKAAADALSAIDCDTGYARARLRLAMTLEKQQKLDDALIQVDECIRLDAGNAAAAELRQTLQDAIEVRNVSAAEKAQAQASRAKEIERARDMEREAVRPMGPAMSATYLHCNFCNEYGHTRNDCPLRRKRPRD
jgi:tetratricopeptide (TPR) repeat protein